VPARALERIGVLPEKRNETFVLANGQEIARDVGYAIICLGDVVTIDAARRRISAGGPRPAACVTP